MKNLWIEKEQPSYYAVIPANVRYDTRLTANEKLLYGEITCLSQKEGYCWASNKYFAELYDVSTRTVSKWVNHLIECGYICSELVYKENSKEVEQRKLCLSQSKQSLHPIEEKFHRPIEEKFYTPIEEKFQDNNINNNNININISRKRDTSLPLTDISYESSIRNNNYKRRASTFDSVSVPPDPDRSNLVF